MWRESRRCGALHLQQSVLALPDDEAFSAAVNRLRAVVAEQGGHTLALRGEPLETSDGQQLTEAWNAARDAEYQELASECRKFLAEIDHEFAIEKFTLAELEEEEAELDKLQHWGQRVEQRDIHSAPAANDALSALSDAQAALARYTSAVFEATNK